MTEGKKKEKKGKFFPELPFWEGRGKKKKRGKGEEEPVLCLGEKNGKEKEGAFIYEAQRTREVSSGKKREKKGKGEKGKKKRRGEITKSHRTSRGEKKN